MINRQLAKKYGYTDEEINAYEASKNPTTPPPPVSPQGFNPTSLLPIAGGIAGGALGGLAGSVVPGAGTAVGAVGGGALGSAGGEWLRQALNNQISGKPTTSNIDYGNVAKEGAYGLAGGAAGEVLGAGARFLGKLAPAAGELGARGEASLAAKQLASGFTVPAKLAPELNLAGAADEIISHGKIPTTPGQFRKLVNTVTGENGLLSSPVRTATNFIKTPINYEQALTDAQSQLTLAGADANTIKTTMNQLRAHFADRTPIKPGEIAGNDAWDVMKQLEKRGYNLINKGTSDLNPNYLLEEQGKALVGVAQDLEGQISGAMQSEGLFPKIQQQILSSLEKNPDIGQGLYKAVQRATSIDDLRGLQSPYVRISRGLNITQDRSLTPMAQAGAGIGGMAQGAAAGFGVGGIPGAVIGSVASPAAQALSQGAKLPLAAAGASVLNAVGKAGQGAAESLGPLMSQGIGQSGARMVGNTFAPPAEATDGQTGNQPFGVSDMSSPTDQTSQSGMTSQQAALLIAKYPKQASIIKTIFDVSNSGSNKKQSQGAMQAENLAKSGLRNYNIVVDELNKDPNVVIKQLIPGQYATRQFDSALFRTVEALLRIRTGQAAPETEVRRYMAQWGPRYGDSKSVIQTKLKALHDDFTDAYNNAIHNNGDNSTPSLPLSADAGF